MPESAGEPHTMQALSQLFKDSKMQAVSIKISPRFELRMNQMARLPRKSRRPRDVFKFGSERHVTIDDIEATITQIVREYSERDRPKQNIVLVGYQVNFDLQAMHKDFAAVANLFTAVVDLPTIFRSLYPVEPVREMSMRSALRIFGYGVDGYGDLNCVHNAGNDAVETLALLHGLTNAQNRENMISEQGREESKEVEDPIQVDEVRVTIEQK
ncbi:hypothetical protein F5Y15DRAFT_53546 [Xylariaceae sp. FL0016]|nr:hypothetical protein F5Y15DRAFT_53546 [Xylariaceae sp. FL0016]